jgi:hypothetical protein
MPMRDADDRMSRDSDCGLREMAMMRDVHVAALHPVPDGGIHVYNGLYNGLV